jgi:DNA helicase HerA-like ATPase
VLDVSGVPAEVVAPIVGTMLRIIYDALFWGMKLPVGGRRQPLLVILDDAHRFLPDGADTPAHRAFSRIAKEGRKCGVGLMIVTQRPSDIDAAVLSQCGTMLALRMTNPQDRRAVHGSIPDDLGALVGLLPSLRTGEALVLGDALQVPSRIRVRKAREKPKAKIPSCLRHGSLSHDRILSFTRKPCATGERSPRPRLPLRRSDGRTGDGMGRLEQH